MNPSTNQKALFAGMALFCLAIVTGCPSNAPGPAGGQPSVGQASNTGTSTAAKGRYRIVTTTGMVADLVKHVAGDHAEVIELIEPGVDPHLFKPTRGDIKNLDGADVVFYSGLHLEGRMTELFEQLSRTKKPVHSVTDGIEKGKLRKVEEDSEHFDPHVWMDVMLWSESLDHIAQSLGKFDPTHADEYTANAKAYRAELVALDDYARKSIGSIPKEQRVLVTAHDAFGYFSKAYGIEVHSVQGVSTESEAGVLDVNRLVDFLVEHKVPAIFVESSVNAKNIEAVIEGAKSRGVTVQIGGELFSDAMGKTGTYEGTYTGMIDHNVTTMAKALGGDVPAKGLNGKLSEN